FLRFVPTLPASFNMQRPDSGDLASAIGGVKDEAICSIDSGGVPRSRAPRGGPALGAGRAGAGPDARGTSERARAERPEGDVAERGHDRRVPRSEERRVGKRG